MHLARFTGLRESGDCTKYDEREQNNLENIWVCTKSMCNNFRMFRVLFLECLECHMVPFNSWRMKSWRRVIIITTKCPSTLNWWVLYLLNDQSFNRKIWALVQQFNAPLVVLKLRTSLNALVLRCNLFLEDNVENYSHAIIMRITENSAREFARSLK